MLQEIQVGWQRGSETGSIPVQVLYSARRTMGLEVCPDGTVRARVPRRASRKDILEFVRERQEWIVQKWFMMKERRSERESRPAPDYIKDPSLEKEYRRRARGVIEQRAAYFASIMGVSYGRISIRAAKTRWGSCSVQGNLNFHWKLVLMPPGVLDYVVVHELAHRLQMNHSPAFWAEVEKVLPDYRERRKWLKEHGREV